ncbi:BrxA/BrxB family bacilliredoxin [Rubeoparvulum massiliense]|uniref:BrxA/BrxB family bacilliredoxin n=1 Tax=Rubeoparvulum massiliense TaxID=1631346 RepID=UPI00065E3F84|nr:BrxA/BrxB family bacilliredoxin [Rubeoparvulum massiliense]
MNLFQTYEEYMNQYIQPMRDELVHAGFQELRTPEEVDQILPQSGTTLVMVNSVCGCAGGLARPAAIQAVQGSPRPDRMTTVFAGQDKEATERAREYFTDYPPSSPSMALLKDGQLVFMLERHQIEGADISSIQQQLTAAFQQHCEVK